MTGLLIKNFVRSKGLMTGLLLLFLSGLISLNVGKHFLEKNQQLIQQTAHFQQENIDRNVKYVNKEIGLLLYYVRFGLANHTPNLAGLSIGQRDINPAVLSVTIRNLEEQKYTTDLMNPMYQLIGNLDFSFVLIYFFPLIIIAFCFNLISEEKEEGTWSLVLSQAISPLKMLRLKLCIRYVSVLTVLLLLLVIAKFYLAIPVDNAFVAFGLTAILYISFWFSVSWLIVSFHRDSSYNALLLLIVWVMLTIVIPASVTTVIVYKYPVPEAFGTVLESRDGYHSKWDQPKEPTIQKFQKHYPQFNRYKHPEGKDYSWLWYYAMQQMGDDEAAVHATDLKTKLRKREAASSVIGLFVPTIHTQQICNHLSQSDMANHLNFIEEVEKFHEQKRLYFYPKIFTDFAIADENWKAFPLAYFQDKVSVNWSLVLIPVFSICVICVVWAGVNFRRPLERNARYE
ncbi:DUF3526 domain-containing protein [Cytophagaceae bacterium YF14B1]|uniref:DUF3526 domain-containing protein n=1 Tax=Xanthocytophaga flava TaxID=3048013 RepID=A0AAE3U8K7_9BACT|nr:DUF3526 domain-containing protein [Xanthocytophaga flavus]MDJ1484124.1 DUF3526 domain-containing protein [Xanthocytophaga flavus]